MVHIYTDTAPVSKEEAELNKRVEQAAKLRKWREEQEENKRNRNDGGQHSMIGVSVDCYPYPSFNR
jgi:hypothetical protein